jgi:hypothetical protein
MRRLEVLRVLRGAAIVAGVAALYLFVLSRGRWP